jgi:hypothetical protein
MRMWTAGATFHTRLSARGLQAFGQLYLDRDNIAGHGLRCDHKMEAPSQRKAST